MMNLFSIMLLLLTLTYGAFILWCLNGWRKLKSFQPGSGNFKTVVSVIIPVRNEEKNISACLQDVLNQNYPRHLFEVIVTDDDSQDSTAEIVSNIIHQFPTHKIILLKDEEMKSVMGSKKKAITSAIQNAKGELIVTTDADCRMEGNWLAALVSYYERESPGLIAGPVCYAGEKNRFEKLQSLEFMGLIGIGAGTISNLKPMMCNGANLAYTRQLFFEVNGFESESPTVSGDDTQLLLKIAKKDPSGIHFLKSPSAIVYTPAMSSAHGLFNQRKRWASKIPVAMSPFTILIAITAYFLHAGLLLMFVSSLFRQSGVLIFIFLLLLKSIPEYFLLYRLSVFFQRKKLMLLFFPAQVFYLVYISVIGVTSVFGTYHWKERRVKTVSLNLRTQ